MFKLIGVRKASIIIAFCIWGGISTSYAQGFSLLIEKLNNLENRIDSLEINTTNQQNESDKINNLLSRVSELELELDHNNLDEDYEFITNSIVELSLKINALESKLETTSVKENNEYSDSETIAEVRSIINELKTFIESEDATKADSEEGFISFGNLDISGFFDVIYQIPDDTDDDTDKGFAINQLELDVESSYSPFLDITGAFAYDGEVIGVGAAFADLHWMGEESSHPVQSTFFDHSGVIIGQFDVPFGADYERLASPDRALFSAPLAVEHTVDGWNDMGLIAYGGRDKWESQIYFVNGDQDNMAYGGRISLKIADFANIGGSMASILNSDDEQVLSLVGGDLVVEYESFGLIGEYIIKQDSTNTNQVDITGYYGELIYGLEKALHKDIYLVGGYSAVKYEDVELSTTTLELNSVILGAGFNINENASIRLEYRMDDGEDIKKKSTSVGQFVITF